MPNRDPFNPTFCKGVVEGECQYLRAHKWCTLAACIYNHKRVIYWGHFGHLPGEQDG